VCGPDSKLNSGLVELQKIRLLLLRVSVSVWN
jgi:hypothetical protein